MTSQKHSNIMYWEGAVTKIGCVSDGIPGGGTVPIVWERTAVEQAIGSLVSMPLNCEWPEDLFSNPAIAFTGHNMRFVIGAVQKVWIDGDYLMCSGIIYKDNFPDVAYMIQNAKDALGFSVECYSKEKQIQDDGYEHVYKVEFTGLTACWQNVAAFKDTFFTQLVACRNKKNNQRVDDNSMTPEEMKALFAEMTKGISEEISKVQASVDQKFTALEEQKKAEDEAKRLEAEKQAEELAKAAENDELAKLKAANEELTAKLEAATKVIPGPTAGQSAVPKDSDVDYNSELDKINKMTCSLEEKVKLRFSLALKAQQ